MSFIQLIFEEYETISKTNFFSHYSDEEIAENDWLELARYASILNKWDKRAGVEVRGIVDSLEDYETCMDITSARKAVVAGALLATADCKPDHIYYLEIDDLMDKAKPYVLIPRQQQLLHDLREETRRPRV